MFKSPSDRTTDLGARNVAVGLRLAGFASAAVVIASVAPPSIVAVTLSALLTVAAVGTALVAAMGSEPVFEDRLTHWDEAALLLLAGVAAGAFARAGAMMPAS